MQRGTTHSTWEWIERPDRSYTICVTVAFWHVLYRNKLQVTICEISFVVCREATVYGRERERESIEHRAMYIGTLWCVACTVYVFRWKMRGAFDFICKCCRQARLDNALSVDSRDKDYIYIRYTFNVQAWAMHQINLEFCIVDGFKNGCNVSMSNSRWCDYNFQMEIPNFIIPNNNKYAFSKIFEHEFLYLIIMMNYRLAPLSAEDKMLSLNETYNSLIASIMLHLKLAGPFDVMTETVAYSR